MSKEFEVIASFLPRGVVNTKLCDPTKLSPQADAYEGVLLQVNFSGFTKLTEIMSTYGAEGLESLTTCLNSFFSGLVAVVDAFGGDIIKIAGDALLIVWRPIKERNPFAETLSLETLESIIDDGSNLLQAQPIDVLISRALECAYTAISIASELDLTELSHLIKQASEMLNVDFRLKIHCGLSSGVLYDVICGGIKDSWETLVCGSDVFSNMTICLNEAGHGEIGLDKSSFLKLSQGRSSAPRYSCTPKKTPKGLTVYIFQAPTASSSLTTLPSIRRHRDSSSLVEPKMSSTKAPPSISNMYKAWMKQIENLDTSTALLRSLMPTFPRRRVESKQYEVDPEIRRCSIAFIGLETLVFNKPQDMEVLQKCIELIQDVAHRLEGFLRQFLMDDKGCVAIIVFGSPGFSHIDDAHRVVEAAWSIFNGLDGLGIDCSIGCTTGRVFCGDIGSISRREYALVGETVNTAAHLMGLRRGIMCSRSIFEFTNGSCDFEPVLGIKLKGRNSQYDAYKVIFYRGFGTKYENVDTLYPKSCRGDEMFMSTTWSLQLAHASHILSSYSSFASQGFEEDGASQRGTAKTVLLVTGKKAVGKRTFAQELTKFIPGQSNQILVCDCSDIDEKSPFSCWAPLVNAAINKFVTPGRDTRESVVRHMLGGRDMYASTQGLLVNEANNCDDMTYLLNPILNLSLPQSLGGLSLEPRNRSQIIRSFLRKILGAAYHSKCCYYVFHKVESMDSSSVKLLEEMCSSLRSGFFILTASEPMPRTLKAFISDLKVDEEKCSSVYLDPFSEDETLGYIKTFFSVKTVPKYISESVHQKAEGIAKSIRDICTILKNHGDLQIENESLVTKVKNQDMQPLLDSIDSLLCQKIDRLDADSLNFLKMASVAGDMFYLQDVVAMSETPTMAIDVNRMINILEDEGLISPLISKLKYRFEIPLAKTSIYHGMPTQQRNALHKKMAMVLESRSGVNSIKMAPVIASHYSACGDFGLAAELYGKAAEYALHSFSIEDAIKLFEEAINNAQQSKDASLQNDISIWTYGIAECNYLSSDYVEAERWYLDFLRGIGFQYPTTGNTVKYSVISTVAKDIWNMMIRSPSMNFVETTPRDPNSQNQQGSRPQPQSLLDIIPPDRKLKMMDRKSTQAEVFQSQRPKTDIEMKKDITILKRMNSCYQLARIQSRLGNIYQSLFYALECKRICLENELHIDLLKPMGFLAYVFEMINHHWKSGIYSRRTMHLLSTTYMEKENVLSQYSSTASVMADIAVANGSKGHLPTSLPFLERGIQYARAGKDIRIEFKLVLMYGNVLYLYGNFPGPLNFLEEAYQLALELGEHRYLQWATVMRSMYQCRFGIGDGLDLLNKLFSLSRYVPTSDHPSWSVNSQTFLVTLSVLTRHPIFARMAVREYSESFLKSPMIYYVLTLAAVSMLRYVAMPKKDRNRVINIILHRLQRTSLGPCFPSLCAEVQNEEQHYSPDSDLQLIRSCIHLLEGYFDQRHKLLPAVFRIKAYYAHIQGNADLCLKNLKRGYKEARLADSPFEKMLCSIAIQNFSPSYQSMVSAGSIEPWDTLMDKFPEADSYRLLRFEQFHV
eukprot:TRINITY_DN9867_c0_g1_i1.p1 TRINITY_DN9867_c0_g1~~TRINITY_DN9867_c0_g1_i1.p1  ORF type:complete len:1580 (-),score=236.44 TRINITY_DN9867_c0_g1_i1:115-4854(-)